MGVKDDDSWGDQFITKLADLLAIRMQLKSANERREVDVFPRNQNERQEIVDSPSSQLVAKLVDVLEKCTVPPVPISIDLWDIKFIAAYLKRDTNSVRDRIICVPDFPKAIRLPTDGKTKRSRPLWRAKDVIAWAESYIEGRPGHVGRPRKNRG